MDAPTDATATVLDWSPALEVGRMHDPATAIDVDEAIQADAAVIIATIDAGETGRPVATDAATVALNEQQQAILEFERLWWRRAGAKEQAIRDRFAMSPTRYYQALNHVLDLPAALSYDATLVNRLQRLRSSTDRTRRLS